MCQDFPNNILHISVKTDLQILFTGQHYFSQISSQLGML